MKKLLLGSLLLSTSLFTFCNAQFTVLHEFNDTTGKAPEGSLILSGNILYGMTSDGGATSNGNIFSMNINGSGFTDLHDFTGADGDYPDADLTYAAGVLYGMTPDGGANHYGNIFSIKANGTGFKDLLDFNGTSTPFGKYPQGSFLLIRKVLYALASGGGASGNGCIFSIDTNGSGYRDIYDFNGTTGAQPAGSLTFSNGKFYGTTYYGGTLNDGIVFSIDTDGNNYKVLHQFDNTYGEDPIGTLVLSGKVLYGMTRLGGANAYGIVFSIDSNGNNFKDLLDFNINNGEYPLGSLIYASGNLFGMTSLGGVSYLSGCMFSIDTNGTNYTHYFDLYSTNGADPHGSLLLSGNTFYGMTYDGGNVNLGTGPGTIFGYKDVGLGVNKLTAVTGKINVYPNPCNGIFTIQLSAASAHADESFGQGRWSVEVYNVLGTQVYSRYQIIQSSNYQIDLSSQPAGIYFYRITAENGSLLGEGKVVIEK